MKRLTQLWWPVCSCLVPLFLFPHNILLLYLTDIPVIMERINKRLVHEARKNVFTWIVYICSNMDDDNDDEGDQLAFRVLL